MRIDEDIQKIVNDIEILKIKLQKLKDQQVKILGRRKFIFPDGESYRYNEITLGKLYYTERGLGYDEDRDHFSEYVFIHPHKKVYVRILSDKNIQKYNIPHKPRSTNVNVYLRHDEYSKSSIEFEAKFKFVVGFTEKYGLEGFSFWNI